MGVEREDSTETAQARTFAVSRDCGSNEWIQKPLLQILVDRGVRVCFCQ